SAMTSRAGLRLRATGSILVGLPNRGRRLGPPPPGRASEQEEEELTVRTEVLCARRTLACDLPRPVGQLRCKELPRVRPGAGDDRELPSRPGEPDLEDIGRALHLNSLARTVESRAEHPRAARVRLRQVLDPLVRVAP